MTQKQKSAATIIIISFVFLFIAGTFYVIDVSSQSEIKMLDQKSNQSNPKPTDTRSVTDPEWTQPINRQALVSQSKAIVVGKVISNICVNSQDSSLVGTTYTFEVSEVIKGNLSVENTIKITLPGGLVPQPDGSMLLVNTPGFKKIKNNATYLLFLKDKNQQEYTTVRGPQGIFELINSSSAIPYANYADKNNKNKEQTIDAVTLLQEIRNLKK
jgi:hypothetical protein